MSELANLERSIDKIEETPVSGPEGRVRRLSVALYRASDGEFRSNPETHEDARIRTLTTAVLAEGTALLREEGAEALAEYRPMSKDDLRAEFRAALLESGLAEEPEEGAGVLYPHNDAPTEVRNSVGPHAAPLVAFARQVYDIEA